MKTSRLLKNITLGIVLSLIFVWTPSKAHAIIGDQTQPLCRYLKEAKVNLLAAKTTAKLPGYKHRKVVRRHLTQAALQIAKAQVAMMIVGLANFEPDLGDSAISAVAEITNDAFGNISLEVLLTCAQLAIAHAEIETMGLIKLDALNNILHAQVIVDSVWGALTCNLL